MAYNLESLTKTIKQIISSRQCNIDPNKIPQIGSLMQKTLCLKQLFEDSSSLNTKEIQSFECRIRDATYEAQDILESQLVDRIHSVGEGVGFTFSPPSLQKVIGELDYIENEMKKMMDGSTTLQDSSSSVAASSTPRKILVGISQDSFQLKDRLTMPEAKLVIIPIVGMGGIGKTTLARYVYDDPFVTSHFDARALVTISQEYSVRVALLGLLESVVGKLTDEMHVKENEQLGVDLHKSLRGRRYLIVLDDMWDNKTWDDISRFLPDDENGSRVMVTTRETSVANYAGSNSSPHHQMHLLNQDDSWDLLRAMIFVRETCPPELERIGAKIANDCRGLPLAIHVIGGLLSQATRTEESWAHVAKDVSSAIANNDEQFAKILSLSYNHLPNHLKPCFLYMSAFPKDHEIRSSYLVKLWVAEGFLKPVIGKSLEEAAEMYLKDLAGRNLIFARRQESNEIVKSYGMHDLLKELCVREACQDKFFSIKNKQSDLNPTNSKRRVSVHSSYRIRDIYDSMESMALARSFLCIGTASQDILSSVFFSLGLLRVLDILGIEFYKFPKEVLQLVNLRYLALASRTSLPSSISILNNLQTIIFREISTSPVLFKPRHQVFGMSHLRHVKFKDKYPIYDLQSGKFFQGHLRTLSGITVDSRFNTILRIVPNLRKLGIFCYYEVSSKIDLKCLYRLETLKCSSNLLPRGQHVLSCLIFPPSLKKLTFHKCRIPVGCLNKISNLPNLQVLKLRDNILESTTWEQSEGEFSKLQFLLLENLNLENWVADETHFPKLKNLIVRSCSQLEEIPLDIGEIPSLESIEVHACSPSVVASARKIQDQQLELGNDGLQVLIKAIF